MSCMLNCVHVVCQLTALPNSTNDVIYINFQLVIGCGMCCPFVSRTQSMHTQYRLHTHELHDDSSALERGDMERRIGRVRERERERETVQTLNQIPHTENT